MANDMESHDSASIVRKITWIGLFVNVLLSGAKFAVGMIASSQALVADAVHSLSDLFTDFAVLFGVRYWTDPPDEKHPYGHERIETAVTALIGMALLFAGFAIGWNGLITITQKHESHPGWTAFAVALVSIVVKEILYHMTVSAGRKANSSAVIANAWHHRSDSFSSIPVALAILAAAINPKWAVLDHVAAVCVSLFIIFFAIGIVKNAFKELTDYSIPRSLHDIIEETAMKTPNVKAVHAVRGRKTGSGLRIDLHVLVDKDLTVKEGHDISKLVKKNLMTQQPDILEVLIHLEPFESTNVHAHLD